MVENPSPASDFITSPELEEGIKNGRITTFTIDEQNLSYYQMAVEQTGFQVEVIATAGQYYITEKISPVRRRLNRDGRETQTPITPVKSQFPVREGYVAILLKRPKGVTNDTAFHLARQKIQPA